MENMEQAQVMLGEMFQRIQQLEAAHAVAPPRIKPPNPDCFSGTDDAKRVRQWIFQVDNYFNVMSEPEGRRVGYATTLLRKNGLLWWQSLAEGERPATWDAFKHNIIEYFQPLSATIVARDNLARLYQRASVKSYVEEFKAQVLNIPDITDAEKLDKFRRGLKKEVRLHVAFANPPTFDQAVSIAEQIDEVLYSHRNVFSRSTPSASYNRPSASVPMEIGAMPPRRTYAQVTATPPKYQKLTPEEKEELRKNNGCFYCRKTGHIALKCPLKSGNSSRRQ